jgi:hypothetical protein
MPEICKLACALMLTLIALLGTVLKERAVISSLPEAVAVNDKV